MLRTAFLAALELLPDRHGGAASLLRCCPSSTSAYVRLPVAAQARRDDGVSFRGQQIVLLSKGGK